MLQRACSLLRLTAAKAVANLMSTGVVNRRVQRVATSTPIALCSSLRTSLRRRTRLMLPLSVPRVVVGLHTSVTKREA